MNQRFEAFLDYRYGEKGGYRVFLGIVTAELPYDAIIDNIRQQFGISTDRARKFYTEYRKMVGAGK